MNYLHSFGIQIISLLNCFYCRFLPRVCLMALFWVCFFRLSFFDKKIHVHIFGDNKLSLATSVISKLIHIEWKFLLITFILPHAEHIYFKEIVGIHLKFHILFDFFRFQLEIVENEFLFQLSKIRSMKLFHDTNYLIFRLLSNEKYHSFLLILNFSSFSVSKQ